MRNSSGTILGTIQFNTAVFGGGGACTGIDIAPDGVKVMRTDVFNCWIKTPTETKWRALFTVQSMPVGDYHDSAGFVSIPSSIRDSSAMGGFECRIAHSNSQYIYATCNCRLYASTDQGATFVRTAVPQIDMRANSGNPPHNLGPNLAIDPNNPLVFLFGTSLNGLYASTDGGATVTNITSLPANKIAVGAFRYPYKVACDPTSTQVGGIRQRWIAVAQGTCPYMSTTGPTGAYTPMTGAAGVPTGCYDMKFGVGGTLWLTDPTLRLSFTGGSVQPAVGDTITGAASGATATVLQVVLTSGSWAGGDAAGAIWINPTNKTLAVSTKTGNTNSTTSITNVSSTAGLIVGSAVTGAGIPAGTTVTAISGTTITISQSATTTATGVAVTFAGETLNDGANTGVAAATAKAASNTNLWKWTAAGGWIRVTNTANSIWTSFATDPADANNIYLVTTDGSPFQYSRDAAATWKSQVFSTSGGVVNRYSTDIAWLGRGLNAGLGQSGEMRFDPSQSGVLYASCGVGLFHCVVPDGTTTHAFNWFEEIAGQEELVANRVITPPGYPAIGLSWDRAVIHWPDPTKPAPGYVTPSEGVGAGVWHGWDGDWAADNPANIYVLCNVAGVIPGTSHHGHGKSRDGGFTWGPYPTEPINSQQGGCMAVGQTGQIAHFYSNNGRPVKSLDDGSSWSYITWAGLPTTGELGFGFSFSDNRKIATYDKVIGAFYVRNYGPGQAPGIRGIWRSADLVTWTQVATGYIGGTDTSTAKLGAVPNNGNHLFFTPGSPSGGTNTFMRCTNASTNPQTWVAAAPAGHTIQNVVTFGFGKPVAGQTYPSIWFYGLFDGVNGLYASFDNLVTVQLIAAYPNNSIDHVTCVTGDLNEEFGVWVGFNGSGFAKGRYVYETAVAA